MVYDTASMKAALLRRFSAYGFLKNQQYYDPFLVVAFLQMGLSYTKIGVLVAFREIIVNLAEIPTGAIADLFGRRRSMITSFASYIVSFLLMGTIGHLVVRGDLASGSGFGFLMIAMVFFGVGEAFRTGTHKAMIFAWLRVEGRTDERAQTYGYTRSWSKIGSAVSVVIASAFVFLTGNYVMVFFVSVVPYLLNVVNLLGYPKYLDGEASGAVGLREIGEHLRRSFKSAIADRTMRRILLESMGFEGFFKSSKGYLQPILQFAAVPLAAVLFGGIEMTDVQRSVVLIGPVYLIVYLLSAVSSRKSYLLVPAPGEEDRAARRLWGALAVLLLIMTPAMFLRSYWIMIPGFVLLHMLQNLWRPILISRIDSHGSESQGATLLSIESQAKSIATMALAPLLGFFVDAATKREWGEFWPVGMVGLVVAAALLVTGRRGRRDVSGR